MSSATVRTASNGDLSALWTINEASTPGVGSVTEAELERLIALPNALTLVATTDAGDPLGFMLLLGPGADYDSPNYRWFEARRAAGAMGAYFYVDRIAVAAQARGAGVGDALYQAAFAAAPEEATVIACEVNTAPPNPGSMRFHAKLGFVEVGAAAHVPGEKEVAYLERPIWSGRRPE